MRVMEAVRTHCLFRPEWTTESGGEQAQTTGGLSPRSKISFWNAIVRAKLHFAVPRHLPDKLFCTLTAYSGPSGLPNPEEGERRIWYVRAVLS